MKILHNILIAVAAFVMAVSCTMADVVEVDESVSRVDVSVDWSQVEGPHSESMYLVASYMSSPMILGYLYPEMTMLNDPAILDNPLMWHAGDYSVLSFTKRDDIIYSDMNNLDHLCVSLPTLTQEQVSDVLGIGVRDYNPGILYIGDAGEFNVSADIYNVPAGVEKTDIILTPRSLVQNLTIRFSLDVEDEIELDGVSLILSGLVGSIYPMKGLVDYENLYKMVLPVELIEKDNGRYTYQAKAHILGILPPESETACVGKGILQLVVSTTSYRGEKVFYAGMNLMNMITEADAMTVNQENMGIAIAKTDVVLDIDNVLVISNESEMIYDANDGVDSWFENKTIDVEL